jgi:uncharacterized membrane protein YecN with MAPEG domain
VRLSLAANDECFVSAFHIVHCQGQTVRQVVEFRSRAPRTTSGPIHFKRNAVNAESAQTHTGIELASSRVPLAPQITDMPITSLYAAILAFLFGALSVRTLLLRRRLQIAVGDGGDPGLLRAIRVHANFAEYVPLCLLLVAFCEAKGTPALWLHTILLSLFVARLSHAYGVSQVREPSGFRVIGVALTLTVLFVSAFRLLLLLATGHGI